MSRVAIVTDSASDLTAATPRPAGITVVPLEVSFGDERFTAGVTLTTEEFWKRMTAPDAPFPKTAAASAGEFQTVFERLFADGAEAIVCINVAGTLSGTIKSATIARDALPGREIHVVDSGFGLDGRGAARPDGQRDGRRRTVRRRHRGRARGAQDRPQPVRRARHARVPQARRADQRHARRRSGRSSRSSRSSRSRTARSRRSTSRGPGRRPASGSSSSSPTRPVERIGVLHTMAEDIDGLPRRAHPPDARRDRPEPRLGPAGRPVGRAAPGARAASARWSSTLADACQRPLHVPTGPMARSRWAGPAGVRAGTEWLYSAADDTARQRPSRTTADAADRGVFREKTQHA